MNERQSELCSLRALKCGRCSIAVKPEEALHLAAGVVVTTPAGAAIFASQRIMPYCDSCARGNFDAEMKELLHALHHVLAEAEVPSQILVPTVVMHKWIGCPCSLSIPNDQRLKYESGCLKAQTEVDMLEKLFSKEPSSL